jgi:hypothetical protein
MLRYVNVLLFLNANSFLLHGRFSSVLAYTITLPFSYKSLKFTYSWLKYSQVIQKLAYSRCRIFTLAIYSIILSQHTYVWSLLLLLLLLLLLFFYFYYRCYNCWFVFITSVKLLLVFTLHRTSRWTLLFKYSMISFINTNLYNCSCDCVFSFCVECLLCV